MIVPQPEEVPRIAPEPKVQTNTLTLPQPRQILEVSEDGSKSQAVSQVSPEPEVKAVDKQEAPQSEKDNGVQANQKTEKCWNRLCRIGEPTKKIRSKIDDRIISLCKICTTNYNCFRFCEVCEQIYSNDDVGDGLEWVECEYEFCKRWNHTECEKKRNRYDKTDKYLCSECQRKYRKKRPQVTQPVQTVKAIKQNKSSSEGVRKIKIFDLRKDNYHYLESFLSSYSSYRLALSEDSIASDITSIRQRQLLGPDAAKRNFELGKLKKKR